MVAIQILSFAALAIGALAGPIATEETSKPFKIGVTFKDTETLYLTSTAAASKNIADGIECTITTTQNAGKTIGKLGCGPEKKAFTYSSAHTTKPLEPVASDNKNVDWSINADDTIKWGALPAGTEPVAFSRQKNGKANAIFAEVCTTFDHHKNIAAVKDFWEKGVAKAYYV
ncbi:hypothetical protein EJ08DRAFT_662077 [Tothia fuscella]|uniref:Uncharacterized protein n=1 Tax=Tothia fuscella TaxID=1048955 RepID=A0A9P4NP69_9PEZI|nr:hypothetical protein EJ08DRAFT_662077 [Tothia fuscella]